MTRIPVKWLIDPLGRECVIDQYGVIYNYSNGPHQQFGGICRRLMRISSKILLRRVGTSMKSKRSDQWWAGLTEYDCYTLEYLEIGDRQSSGYDGSEHDHKSKHECAACGDSVYGHTGVCSSCFYEMIWLIAKADKAYLGEMPPPWLAFPEYEPDCMGWRLGVGEDYVNEWFSFYDALTDKAKTEYQQKYPASPGYDGWYFTATFFDRFDRIPTHYDPITHNLQMIRYHRNQVLEVRK